MKRIVCLVLVVVSIFSLFACGEKEVSYEQSLYDQSEEIKSSIANDVKEIRRQGVDLSITVQKIEDNVYDVILDGETQRNKFEGNNDERVELKEVEDIYPVYLDIVDNARNKVINYINSSAILKDKEKLVEGINKISVKVAVMDSIGLTREEAIYIDKYALESYSDSLIEYALAHEYIHALAAITNGGIDKEVYGRNKLNEAITDIITAKLYPEISETNSAYSDYYYYVLGYIACFKEKSLEAYFYGYDDIWERVGKDEFDFFVEMFANAPNNMYAFLCYNAFIIKWLN